MFCKSCGTKIDDDSIFCYSCGSKQSGFSMPNIKNEQSTQNFEKVEKQPKYDPTYSKEVIATIVGVTQLLLSLIFLLAGPPKFNTYEDYLDFRTFGILLVFIFRIVITFWVVNIAKRQNRETLGWGFLAFFLPSIALIIIGQLKKLNKFNNGIQKQERTNKNSEISKNKNIPSYKESAPIKEFDFTYGYFDKKKIIFSDNIVCYIYWGYSSEKYYFFSFGKKKYCENKLDCITKVYFDKT